MSIPDKYEFFWGGVFSQWFKCTFTFEHQEFVSAEQAMMFSKAQMFKDKACVDKILATNDPKKQKALGRTVKNFSDAIWDERKYALILDINYAKFSQNKGLRRKLFQVQNRDFVEASPFDLIWGIGLDEAKAKELPEASWPGQNLLGKAITEVRDLLRTEHPDEFELCSKMEDANA